MSKVEYVGLYLDETGYTFTAEKKDSVLNFPQPESQNHEVVSRIVQLLSHSRPKLCIDSKTAA